MNNLSPSKPTSAQAVPADHLADAREETYRLLQSVVHYSRCAQMHLEIADDPVAFYDIVAARGYFISAIRALEPIRAAIRKEGADAEGRQID